MSMVYTDEQLLAMCQSGKAIDSRYLKDTRVDGRLTHLGYSKDENGKISLLLLKEIYSGKLYVI